MLNIISLGAGVQSSTMALMAACGEITPMPQGAIFADTKHESRATYTWLDRLERDLPFPVYRVSKGDLWKSATRVRTTRDGERRYIETAIPVHMMTEGEKGLGLRHCTADFKIAVIRKELRRLLGKSRIGKSSGVLVTMWFGISKDEASRESPSKMPWIENRHPLLDMEMNRADCLGWMLHHGYPDPPRSACTFCPYRDDDSWIALDPDERDAVARKEIELQTAYATASAIKGTPWLHRDRKPISAVKFISAGVKPKRDQMNLFLNHCGAMCSV